MNRQPDDWGRDPQVLYLRQVFAALEKAQAGLLEGLGLAWSDPRLAPARSEARACFERAWPRAQGRGLGREPGEAALLYLCCLARSLSRQGVNSPPELLPEDGIWFALAAGVLT